MTNTNQNMYKPDNSEKIPELNAKIKETWGKLSDDDIKLYNGNRDQFFAALKEKQGVSKEDGEKHLQEIQKSCATSCSTEKTSAAKAA
jgi:uncharacterized protein YjbJ (UPF0337 family)